MLQVRACMPVSVYMFCDLRLALQQDMMLHMCVCACVCECVYVCGWVGVIRFNVSAATKYDVAGVCVRVCVFVCGCG